MSKRIDQAIGHLRKTAWSFAASRVLLAANNLRVFDHLEKPVTARALAKRLSMDARATTILLDALTALGFVKKDGSRYRNSHVSSLLLVKGKPYYQGDILAHNEVLWQRWSELDSIVKTGRPAAKRRFHDSFIRGMHNVSVLKAGKVVSSLDLTGVKTVLDLGGGPGTYSIEFAKRGLDVTLFDVKETFRIAREYISAARFKGTVNFLAGDFLTDDIGKGYDLVFVSQVLHAYSEKENMRLLRKIRRSLNEKGRVVIQEFLVNDSRTSPASGALFAVNMLVNTSAGRTYSPSEMAGWLRKTGFGSVKKTVFNDNVIMTARKPGR